MDGLPNFGKAAAALVCCTLGGVCGGLWQESLSFGAMVFFTLNVILYAGDRD